MYVNNHVVPTLSKKKRKMSLPLASDCKELHETAEKLRRTCSMSLPKFAPSLSSLGTGTHNASLFHEFSLPLFLFLQQSGEGTEKRLRKSLFLRLPFPVRGKKKWQGKIPREKEKKEGPARSTIEVRQGKKVSDNLFFPSPISAEGAKVIPPFFFLLPPGIQSRGGWIGWRGRKGGRGRGE